MQCCLLGDKLLESLLAGARRIIILIDKMPYKCGSASNLLINIVETNPKRKVTFDQLSLKLRVSKSLTLKSDFIVE